MDETGCNTNQKKDDYVGGKHYVVGKGEKAEKTSAHTDNKFTLLPIHNAENEAVLAVLIYTSESDNLAANLITGLM